VAQVDRRRGKGQEAGKKHQNNCSEKIQKVGKAATGVRGAGGNGDVFTSRRGGGGEAPKSKY